MGVIYTGVVGRYVLPAIQTARQSIDIISPYLSPEYAQLLMAKARSGVAIRIITSDNDMARHQSALSNLKSHPTSYVVTLPRFWLYLAATFLIGLTGSLFFGAFSLLFAVIVALVLIIVGVHRGPTGRYLPLAVKIESVRRLVHVKLYIIDRRIAIAGSANLTFSGMNKNVERIEMKTIPAEVQQEINAFSGLWGDYPSSTMRTNLVSWKNKAVFRELS